MASRPTIVLPRDFVVDLHGAFLHGVDLSGAKLRGANFAGTDFTGADLRGADLREANLEGTILKGADLREAKGLTWEQLSQAVIDETTRLPDYLEARAAKADAE